MCKPFQKVFKSVISNLVYLCQLCINVLKMLALRSLEPTRKGRISLTHILVFEDQYLFGSYDFIIWKRGRVFLRVVLQVPAKDHMEGAKIKTWSELGRTMLD